MTAPTPTDYERIKPPKKGRPYNYKCRYCGAPAAWKETFESRDRRRCRAVWCICDECYQKQAVAGEEQLPPPGRGASTKNAPSYRTISRRSPLARTPYTSGRR
ncbi:hypothetical protein [Methanoculleus sp.]|uniref:hypothetical protein n=1 Tax=Methanoculleus sp. TaxID=90427 RepID=UPI001BD273F6|nr:hypothetical protein [Methanoculleus sp.]